MDVFKHKGSIFTVNTAAKAKAKELKQALSLMKMNTSSHRLHLSKISLSFLHLLSSIPI